MINKTRNHDFIHGESYADGVMFNDNRIISVAIRLNNDEIKTNIKEKKSIIDKSRIFNCFIIHGLITFFEGSINQSIAEQDIKKLKNKLKTKKSKTSHFLSVLSIILLRLILYFIFPTIITYFSKYYIHNIFLLNLFDIILRLFIFLALFWAICHSRNVKKSSFYHGAEHKVGNCFLDKGKINYEKIKEYSIYNPACGTSLILSTIFISIPFFIFIPYDNLPLRILIIFLLSPIILGIAADINLWYGKSKSKTARILAKPGMHIQRLNTREPTDKHIEVAVISLENLLEFRKK